MWKSVFYELFSPNLSVYKMNQLLVKDLKNKSNAITDDSKGNVMVFKFEIVKKVYLCYHSKYCLTLHKIS